LRGVRRGDAPKTRLANSCTSSTHDRGSMKQIIR
jgi:hypothetical protein